MKKIFNLEEETRNDYVIKKEMKKIWSVELDIFNKILKICKKYNLKIFADSGTLLGAIRHEGFIPWDDDIDLAMLREDYNKLIEVASIEFDEDYFFQTEQTDPGSHRCHIQIRKSGTTGILYREKDKKYSFNQGIFVDIFPLDALPNNLKKRKKFVEKVYKKKKNSERFNFLTICYREETGFKGKIKKILHILLNGFAKKYRNIFYKSFEKYIQTYNTKENADYIANLAFNPLRKKGIYKKEYYNDLIMKKFENTKMPVPVGYEEVLNSMFGEWKIPKQASTSHGEVLYDTEKSYKEYLK